MLKSEAAIQAGDQASMQSVRPARPAGNSTLNQQITFLCHFWPLASVKWRYIAINRGLLGGCRVVDVQESAVHSPRLKQHAQQPLHQGIGRYRCQQQRRDGCQRGQGHHHHRLPRDRERAHVFYRLHAAAQISQRAHVFAAQERFIHVLAAAQPFRLETSGVVVSEHTVFAVARASRQIQLRAEKQVGAFGTSTGRIRHPEAGKMAQAPAVRLLCGGVIWRVAGQG